MSYQASHDALTGLVNRREFERRLQESLEEARAGGGPPRALLPRPRPLQGGQRRVRSQRGRQHAPRGRRAHQGRGARLRHRRAPRRRRVRHAAGRLPAREGAADRRRRGAHRRRLPLRLEGQDLHHRRQRRPRRDLARERLARGRDRRRRLGLLRGQEAGRARARVLGARRGRGAQPWRDPVAAAAADGAASDGRFELHAQPIVAVDETATGGPGARGAAAAARRRRRVRDAGRVHASPPSATG